MVKSQGFWSSSLLLFLPSCSSWFSTQLDTYVTSYVLDFLTSHLLIFSSSSFLRFHCPVVDADVVN